MERRGECGAAAAGAEVTRGGHPRVAVQGPRGPGGGRERGRPQAALAAGRPGVPGTPGPPGRVRPGAAGAEEPGGREQWPWADDDDNKSEHLAYPRFDVLFSKSAPYFNLTTVPRLFNFSQGETG